jgi:hypothetical protein
MNRFTIIDDVFDDGDKYTKTRNAPLNFSGKSELGMMYNKRVGSVNDRPDESDMIIDISEAKERHPRMPMAASRLQSSEEVVVPPLQFPPLPPHPRNQMYQDMQCRDVFEHIENCPICNSYVKRDTKFYWMIIAILVIIIFVITKK